MGFSDRLINWYHRNRRTLPWRQTKDPYIIWLSEVILQQTRVDQGLPYFHRFLERFPDVTTLAEASEDEVLLLWQGLGYYARARNMHQTAKAVAHHFQGVFPSSYDTLIRLKGIGEYTAAAISSFAADEPRAVVDGNVFRVLARYFGIDTPINSSAGKKMFLQLANELLDDRRPGLNNQAIMEFGAIHCRPRNPDCVSCIFRPDCRALAEERVDQLPVKTKARDSRNRYFHYFVVSEGDKVAVRKRGKGDIWENLYELPLIETPHPIEPHELIAMEPVIDWFGPDVQLEPVGKPVKHVLSHQNLHAQFFRVRTTTPPALKKMKSNYVFKQDLDKLAKPKLILSFLKEFMVE